MVTKRKCGGTTAKLTICVGMNTPLCEANQPKLSLVSSSFTSAVSGVPVTDECRDVCLREGEHRDSG